MPVPWRLHIALFAAGCLAATASDSSAQADSPVAPHPVVPLQVSRYSPVASDAWTTSPSVLSQTASESMSANDQGGFRARQVLLVSGVAVSMLAYGYFALQFNNSRTDAETARLAYEADVRENAQYYVDEGIPLDELETYRAWDDAYTDAANAREWITIAGLSAFLLGLAAVLDAATTNGSDAGANQARQIVPTLGLSPSSGDVVLGARIGL